MAAIFIYSYDRNEWGGHIGKWGVDSNVTMTEHYMRCRLCNLSFCWLISTFDRMSQMFHMFMCNHRSWRLSFITHAYGVYKHCMKCVCSCVRVYAIGLFSVLCWWMLRNFDCISCVNRLMNGRVIIRFAHTLIDIADIGMEYMCSVLCMYDAYIVSHTESFREINFNKSTDTNICFGRWPSKIRRKEFFCWQYNTDAAAASCLSSHHSNETNRNFVISVQLVESGLRMFITIQAKWALSMQFLEILV